MSRGRYRAPRPPTSGRITAALCASRQFRAAAAPGARWEYNNFTYTLFGVVLERMTERHDAEHLRYERSQPVGDGRHRLPYFEPRPLGAVKELSGSGSRQETIQGLSSGRTIGGHEALLRILLFVQHLRSVAFNRYAGMLGF